MGTQVVSDHQTEPGQKYLTGSEYFDGIATGLTVAAVLLIVAILVGWTLGRLA